MDFSVGDHHLAIADAVDRVCADFDDTYWTERDQLHEFPSAPGPSTMVPEGSSFEAARSGRRRRSSPRCVCCSPVPTTPIRTTATRWRRARSRTTTSRWRAGGDGLRDRRGRHATCRQPRERADRVRPSDRRQPGNRPPARAAHMQLNAAGLTWHEAAWRYDQGLDRREQPTRRSISRRRRAGSPPIRCSACPANTEPPRSGFELRSATVDVPGSPA